jgi:hypothetical protein
MLTATEQYSNKDCLIDLEKKMDGWKCNEYL